MKIVVTGALGHIGSRLIRELPSADPKAELLLVDNLMTQRYCSLFNLPRDGNYRFIEFDILKDDPKSVVVGADAVIHLAAMTDATYSVNNRDEVEHANLSATLKVAQACIAAQCSMLHVSTASVYGTAAPSVDEDCAASELQPQSPYAATKLKEERLLQDLGEKRGLRYAICRFGTICGVSPGMRFHTAVNKFCWQAVIGQPLTVWRTAMLQKRPYLDLADAVEVVKFILQENLFDRQIYNVLSENLTVGAITEMIRRHVPDISIKHVDSQIMNTYSYDVSSLKLQKLGFEFNGNIAGCIADTVALLRSTRMDLRPFRR